MLLKKSIQGLLLVYTLCTALTVHAAQRDEVINGATCTTDPIPYSAGGFPSSGGYPYFHWLNLYGGTATCQLVMSNDWQVENLVYVLFAADVFGGAGGSGALSARLCVNSTSYSFTCGSQGTIAVGGFPIGYAYAPTPTPPYSTGAFVQFFLPYGQMTAIRQLFPNWNK